ncbi:MAG: hypothetical protein KVP17_001456 [Porospora cf. gigantea B]|uniref:uncharacterized protein n=1 Tax=Porospora cf. gigantea B TaxID=2853592 RepID=UPI003571C614|nr:MAG: hypothetical protein KVP17_001456 [Porospora cf. gigantea B]
MNSPSLLARCFTRDVARSELHHINRNIRRLEAKLDSSKPRQVSWRKVVGVGIGTAAFLAYETGAMGAMAHFSKVCARRAERLAVARTRNALARISSDASVQTTIRDAIFNAFNTEEGITMASEWFGSVIQTPEAIDYAAATMEASITHPKVTGKVFSLARGAAKDVLSDTETIKATQSHVHSVLTDPVLADTASRSIVAASRRIISTWIPFVSKTSPIA